MNLIKIATLISELVKCKVGKNVEIDLSNCDNNEKSSLLSLLEKSNLPNDACVTLLGNNLIISFGVGKESSKKSNDVELLMGRLDKLEKSLLKLEKSLSKSEKSLDKLDSRLLEADIRLTNLIEEKGILL